jgi:DNA replication initiation complex subunit (GINS family)
VYDELYEAWMHERENAEIQALTKDFFSRLAEYVKKLREESRMLDEKSTRARLLLQESKNVRKLSEELMRLRFEKAMKKAMAGESIEKENLTVEEKGFLRETVSSGETFQSFLKNVLSGRSSSGVVEVEEKADVKVKEKEKAKKRVLRFLREVPAVVGVDMRSYGPFLPEDVANVPVENAKILVKQGLAVEVEVKT